MDIQLREKWVVLRLNYPNIYPDLYQLTGNYFSDELDKSNVIVFTLLSYSLMNEQPKNITELNNRLINEHEKNCQHFKDRQQSNLLQLNALQRFIVSMNNTERTPVMSPPLEDTPDMVNTVFRQIFLNGLTIAEVGELYDMDSYTVNDYYHKAIHQNSILLHGVATTKKI